jgi:hypothetical protein
MSKSVYALSWSAASQTYVLSGPRSGEDLSIAPDGPAWFAWLAERSSFAFHGQGGSYTARLEAVQRGERYWYAYRRTGQKLRKKYLGKTTDRRTTTRCVSSPLCWQPSRLVIPLFEQAFRRSSPRRMVYKGSPSQSSSRC